MLTRRTAQAVGTSRYRSVLFHFQFKTRLGATLQTVLLHGKAGQQRIVLNWKWNYAMLLVARQTAVSEASRAEFKAAAGFDAVQLRGRWYGVLTFWTARKPGGDVP